MISDTLFSEKHKTMVSAGQTTASAVASYILALSNPEIGDIISNLKLQKLLYYAQGVYIAAFDAPLFGEELSAWAYGPIVESVYHNYKIFGSNAILIPANTEHKGLSKAQKQFLNQIYAYYGQFSALKLMQMTHAESPWQTAVHTGGLISQEKLGVFFKSQPIVAEITNLSESQKLKNAALFLLADYENDADLTDLTLITDDFYEA